jgi:hypothetical protein
MSYLSLAMRGSALALAAVVGTFAFVSTAEAQSRISRRVWDPKFNTDLQGTGLGNLGWSGEVEFAIKDDCYNNIHGDGWITNLSAGCVGKLSINSASVTLYDVYNAATPKVQLSYDDSWNIAAGGNAQATLRMYVDYVSETEKNLIAVEGGFLFPEFTSASFAKVANYDAAAYWLNFNSNTSNAFRPFDNSRPLDGYAFLTSCSYRSGSSPDRNETVDHYKSTHLDVACSQNDGNTFPAILKPVPEPEAYLLALASFGVLGVWSRRRRLNAR